METHPDLDVSVHIVWLPMFPRPLEWWALPRMVEEFSEWGAPQYWDDQRHVSLEVRRRIAPGVEDRVPWDMFILFGPGATWADAEKHVIGWVEPVIHHTDELETLLRAASTGGEDANAQ